MNSEEQICRVCYDEKGTTPEMQFISPCSCIGDQLFIHKKCFSKWINVDRNSTTYTKCPTCKRDYVRSSSKDFSKSVSDKSLITILTLTSGAFLLFLCIFLGCTLSSVFCSIAIFIFYLVTIFYFCIITGNDNYVYYIFLIYLLALYSDPKIKLFSALLWGIVIFSIFSYELVVEKWTCIQNKISNEFLKEFKAKFYDFYLKTFVDL